MKFHCICVWLFAANFASVYNAVLEEALLNEERIEDGFIAEHASDFKMIKTNLINMRLIPNTFNIGLGMLKSIFSRFTNSSEVITNSFYNNLIIISKSKISTFFCLDRVPRPRQQMSPMSLGSGFCITTPLIW